MDTGYNQDTISQNCQSPKTKAKAKFNNYITNLCNDIYLIYYQNLCQPKVEPLTEVKLPELLFFDDVDIVTYYIYYTTCSVLQPWL